MSTPEPADGWRRLHPATPLFRSLQLMYGYAIGVFAASFSFGPSAAIVLFFAVLIAVWAIVSYLRFSYRVTPEDVVVKHGVLFRQRRVIPRSRIQNVDLRAGLLQQIFGVVTARIETAGGSGTEATLQVVSRKEGVRLRNALVGRISDFIPDPAMQFNQAGDAGPSAAPDTSVRRVGPLDLAIAGATSNRAGVLFGFLFGLDYAFDQAELDAFVSPLQALTGAEIILPREGEEIRV